MLRVRRRILLCGLSVLCVLIVSACSVTPSLFRQYEYEEEVYLSLVGSATVYVNSSLAALNALRGTAFDPFGSALVRRVERALIADYEAGVEAALDALERGTGDLASAIALAKAPEAIRGYEEIKLESVRVYLDQLAALGVTAPRTAESASAAASSKSAASAWAEARSAAAYTSATESTTAFAPPPAPLTAPKTALSSSASGSAIFLVMMRG